MATFVDNEQTAAYAAAFSADAEEVLAAVSDIVQRLSAMRATQLTVADVQAVAQIARALPIRFKIETYMSKAAGHEAKMQAKDEEHFMSQINALFADLSLEVRSRYTFLFTVENKATKQRVVTMAERDRIWNAINNMEINGAHFVHYSRGPYLWEGTHDKCYEFEYMKQVDLEEVKKAYGEAVCDFKY